MKRLISSAASLLLPGFVIAAGNEAAQLCRTPPKLIVADSKYEDSPPSTAMPPVGTVVLEVTVTIDGTTRDVLVVA